MSVDPHSERLLLTDMEPWLISDEIWALIEPLLPERKSSPKGGRPPVSDRAALTGILYVLRTGIAWEFLPQEMGCGSGMTCWRRLRDWHQAGIWDNLQRLLESLDKGDQIDWSRASDDASMSHAHEKRYRQGSLRRIGARRSPHDNSLRSDVASNSPSS